jgi:hypothetical protein
MTSITVSLASRSLRVPRSSALRLRLVCAQSALRYRLYVVRAKSALRSFTPSGLRQVQEDVHHPRCAESGWTCLL